MKIFLQYQLAHMLYW